MIRFKIMLNKCRQLTKIKLKLELTQFNNHCLAILDTNALAAG